MRSLAFEVAHYLGEPLSEVLSWPVPAFGKACELIYGIKKQELEITTMSVHVAAQGQTDQVKEFLGGEKKNDALAFAQKLGMLGG